MKKVFLFLAVAVVAVIVVFTLKPGQKQLTVLSWDYYIGPDTISDFEEETGIDVTYELIKSNEEALARVKANPGVYDVIVVADYIVDQLRREGGALKLDPAKISNSANIGEDFRGGYFDENMEYHIPYAYGTIGFAVNTKYFSGSTITWKELADPKYKGKIAVTDDMRYVLGSVLLELGYSPNSTSQTEIDEAVALIRRMTPNIAKFTSDSAVDLMVNEDVWIAYAWSGDSLQMHTENEDIEYRIPSYGALKFLDNMLIPADAPHADSAYEWINFILRPDQSAAITEEIQYGNPNKEAFPLIDEAVRNDPTVFPAPEVMSKLQFIQDVGDSISLYDEAWEHVKQ